MTREEARKYILARSSEHFRPDRSGKGYICPCCGSGTGSKGTGITTKDGVHFTCWTGCFQSADVFDIIGQEQGLTDYSSQLQAACKEYGITLGASEPDLAARPPEHAAQHSTSKADPEEPEPDYLDFFRKANRNLSQTDYHRGLSRKTLDHFLVGYVEAWKHPKIPFSKPSPRLIIPTSRHSYAARDTRSNLTEKQQEDCKMKVGQLRIFNSKAIETADKPIIITEGEIDAMSIYEVGGEAIGLGGLNVDRLLGILEGHKPKHPLIIALDNDKDPETRKKVDKAAEELEDGLDKLKINHYRINIQGDYKDANEALNADREALRAAVEEAEMVERKDEMEKLRNESNLNFLDHFVNEIKTSKPAVPTGFQNLDDRLDGGLYPGLYMVGAISSLGKTSFCLQIADNIARKGRKVLYISLEMARSELIAKSISRNTFQETLRTGADTRNAKTMRGILDGSRYAKYSSEERQLIQTAYDQYREYAGNIWIMEGIGDIAVSDIREKVEHFQACYQEAPVVIIDYLQILAPSNEHFSDKQNTDKAVKELKWLSRDYKLPIIAISSFNRDNYLAPVNQAGFKESGAIEYTSDVLIGLQYEGMDYQEGEQEKDRQKRIRQLIDRCQEDGDAGRSQPVQVKILKNRSSKKGSTFLDFYPVFSSYESRDLEEFTDLINPPEF